MRQIFLDTETTGLSPESGDRILEIGCVELVNRRRTGNDLHFYVNPQRASHDDALKVHGLTQEFLADKPVFAAVAEQLLEYLAGAEIVIHNASFDVGFLNEELRRMARPKLHSYVAQVSDSLMLARERYPGKSNSLDALCKRLEVDNAARSLHGALLDAGLLAEVYIRMTRGQDRLVIDLGDTASGASAAIRVDLAGLDLIVIEADALEIEAHQGVLAAVAKASGGRAVWRLLA